MDVYDENGEPLQESVKSRKARLARIEAAQRAAYDAEPWREAWARLTGEIASGATGGGGPTAVPSPLDSPEERLIDLWSQLDPTTRANLPYAQGHMAYQALLGEPADLSPLTPPDRAERERTLEVTGGRKAETKEVMEELGMGSRTESVGGK